MDNDGPVCSDSWKAHTVIAGIIQGPENLKFFLEPNLAVMAAKTRNARRANLFYDFLTLPVSVRVRRLFYADSSDGLRGVKTNHRTVCKLLKTKDNLVAGGGFEPPTFGL
jgi:hypothetical protein